MTRTYAITTPKPCQDRKVAAIRDACDRRKLRVFLLRKKIFKVLLLRKLYSISRNICQVSQTMTHKEIDH